MKFRRKGIMPGVMATMLVLLLGIAPAVAQSAPQGDSQTGVEEKTPMADQVFKNVQLLKGISVKEFMNTMGFFSASTGMNCIDCHSPEAANSLNAYAIDTPLKQTARKMMLMVTCSIRALSAESAKLPAIPAIAPPTTRKSFQACWTSTASRRMIRTKSKSPAARRHSPPQISADQVLDKYIQAIGGAAQIAKLTSFVAKGTYEGYATYSREGSLRNVCQRPQSAHHDLPWETGDSVNTYDGNHGWTALADKLMRVLPLAGGDLEGAKMDASLSFPASLKQQFKWRTGFPSVTIDDHPVQIIQEASGGETGIKLYFDTKSGLLLRQVRYADTVVGVIPTQVDYSDYRLVAGVKMPFHVVVTWTDDKADIVLSEVQPNVHIDAAKFATPAPPKAKTATP